MQQKPAPKQINNCVYFLEHRLGKGSSSVVYLGQHILTNQPVAIKVIDAKSLKTDVERMLMGNEMKALKIMNHENVIRATEIYQTANNIYIIYEYCQLGDLQHYILSKGRLSEQQSTGILLQLLSGVIHIHSKGVIHRDLKPQNILLKNSPKDKVFKIIDFGFCQVSDSKLQQPYNVGSPLYMSPEAYKKSKYSIKSDCWALGVIFLEMLLGDLPFRGIEYDALVKQLSLAEPYKNLTCSSLTKILLSKMLAVEPQRRIEPSEAYNLIASSKLQHLRVLGVSNQGPPQIQNQSQTIVDSNRPVANLKNEFMPNQKDIRGSLVMNHSPIPKAKPRDISPAKPLERAIANLKSKQTTPIQQPQPVSSNRDLALNKIRLCEYFYSFICTFQEAKSMFAHSSRIILLSLKLIKLSLQSVTVMFEEEPRILTEEEQENLRNQIFLFNEMQVRYGHNTLFADLYFSFTLEYLRLQYQFLNYLQFWVKITISQMKKMSQSKERKECPLSVYTSYLYLLRLHELLEHAKKTPNKIQTLPENKTLDRLIADKSGGNALEQIRHLEQSWLKSIIA